MSVGLLTEEEIKKAKEAIIEAGGEGMEHMGGSPIPVAGIDMIMMETVGQIQTAPVRNKDVLSEKAQENVTANASVTETADKESMEQVSSEMPIEPVQTTDQLTGYEITDQATSEVNEIDSQVEEGINSQSGALNLSYDPVKAITIAKMGEGYRLDQETQNKVNEILGTSKAARAIFGMDAENTIALYQKAEMSGNPDDLVKANVTRRDYLRGNVTSIIGLTLGTYYEKMKDKNFPDELRDDMTGAILQVAMEAEEAYERGEFKYDPKSENLYEEYCKSNPKALRAIRGVNRTIYLMHTEERNEMLLKAENTRKAEEQLLNDAKTAVRSGEYTVEQFNLVADHMPVVTKATALGDPTYAEKRALLYEDKRNTYATPGSWYNEKTMDYLIGLGLEPDFDSAVAVAYETELMGFVENELLKDERISRGLNYENLDAYYAAQGGFNIENLYARATVAMQEYGDDVTQDEIDAMEKEVYLGTGENIGTGEVLLKSMGHGAAYAASEALESFWMLGQVTNEARSDIIAQSKDEAMGKYTPVLSRWGREKEWREYLETGMYPSEEYRVYVERVLDSNIDVFQLGPVPDIKNLILRGAVAADKTTEKTGKWAQKMLNEEQGKLFEAGSGMTSNTMLQAMSALLTVATGSELLAADLITGVMDVYPKEMRKQLSHAENLSEANAVAGLKATGATVNETVMDIGLTGKLLDVMGFSGVIQNGKQVADRVDTARSVSGMWKAFGKAFAKSAVESAGDNLVVEETTGRWIDQFIDGAAQSKQTGADLLEAIGAGLGNVKVTGTIDDVLRDVPEGFVYSMPVIFATGLSDGWLATKRAAQELMITGKSEAASAFVGALNEDVKDPKNKAELNQYLSDVKTGQMAAGIVMTDGETRAAIKDAQIVQEEADYYKAEVEKSTEAMEVAAQQYEAKIEEVTAGVPGSGKEANAVYDEYVGHQSDAQKYGEEYEKKATEADELMRSAVSSAMNKATIEVNRQAQKQWEMIKEENQNPAYEKKIDHTAEYSESDDGMAGEVALDKSTEGVIEQKQMIEVEKQQEQTLMEKSQEGDANKSIKTEEDKSDDILRLPDEEILKSLGSKATNYDILDKETGKYYHFVEGKSIQNSQAFAGYGTHCALHEGVAEGLSNEFGGDPEKWQHAKGIGIVDIEDGERKAEVHWFSHEQAGKVKHKIKRWLD